MSTIDQAFIKAYTQPPKGKTKPPSRPNAQELMAAISREKASGVSGSPTEGKKKAPRKPSSKPAAVAATKKKSSTAVTSRTEKKTAASASKTKKSAGKKPLAPPRTAPQGPQAAETSYRLDPPQGNLPAPRLMPLKAAASAGKASPGDTLSLPPPIPPNPGKTSPPPPHIPLAESPAPAREATTGTDRTIAEGTEHGGQEGDGPIFSLKQSGPSPSLRPVGELQDFRPALQVEYLSWPHDCGRLESAAGAEVDRVADCLENARREGKTLFGFAAIRPGEGVTTLLLAAAKRLIERGHRLLLADADTAVPQLARRLGILPQVGWEEALAGRLSLAEAAVESLQEGSVVLPLRSAIARETWDADVRLRWTEAFLTLRGHFDFGLADLGAWERSPWAGGGKRESTPGGLDAVLLVRHPQKTAYEELLNVQQQFLQAGTPVLGVVENYVREILAASAKTV
ncbi:MAG: hypothetical protein JXB10_08575 [Pirellulales bacterium]|nr:hypothetical protein [Pirellulales bacterium]